MPMSVERGGRAPGSAGPTLLAALAVLACLAGCRPPLMVVDGGQLRQRELGYRIDPPGDPAEGRWRRIDVDGADVAWTLESDAEARASAINISLSSTCRKTAAKAAVLSRQLALGTAQGKRLASEPVTLGPAEGWSQSFETREEGVALRVKTVTLLSGGCVYDWVLVTPASDVFQRIEPGFDAWWRSFEAPARTSPEGDAHAREGSTG